MSDAGLTRVESELLAAFEAGEARALARAISWVEDERPGFERLLRALHGRLGNAHRIGVTGPPGAGKSTLIRALALEFRRRGERVGVAAVDPSSPFTGGALLGDRIRMREPAGDDGVFIRSMATRGSPGGLAATTREVADLMDAFGFDRVVVETVGVGQSELEIAGAADTTVVVLNPESGDAIQMMKAGLMEIADIFVVNKCDRPGAERVVQEVRAVLHLRRGQALKGVPVHHTREHRRVGPERTIGARGGKPEGSEDRAWEIPVVAMVAEVGEGVQEWLETLDAHVAWLRETGELAERRQRRARARVRAAVERRLLQRAWSDDGGRIIEEARGDLESGRRTPYDVAEEILRKLGVD